MMFNCYHVQLFIPVHACPLFMHVSIMMFNHVHACSLIYTDEKNVAVDSETVCLWLVDHSY